MIRWTVEEYSAVDEFALMPGVEIAIADERLTVGLDALVDHLDGYEAAVQEG